MLRGEFDKPYWPELQAFVRPGARAPPGVPAGTTRCSPRCTSRRTPTRGSLDPRPGPVPRPAPGARAVLLGARGRAPSRRRSSTSTRSCRPTSASSRPTTATSRRGPAQGVLLLNTTLTVRGRQRGVAPGQGLGDVHRRGHPRRRPPRTTRSCSSSGAATPGARRRCIDTARHTIIESAHPSPLSAHNGFFGSRPFSPHQRRPRGRRPRPRSTGGSEPILMSNAAPSSACRIGVRTRTTGPAVPARSAAGRAADVDDVLAGRDDPARRRSTRRTPGGRASIVDRAPRSPAATSTRANAGEVAQRAGRVAARRLDVDLHDLAAGAFAGVRARRPSTVDARARRRRRRPPCAISNVV